MTNFWRKLPKPIWTLAPMDDVTDAAFRRIIAKYGKPAVIYTEFVSADGLCSPGLERLLPKLKYSRIERPIVAQIFGSNLANLTAAAKLCRRLKFDGIDINMGCPDKNVCQHDAGAAMMRDPRLARAAIRAVRDGAGGLPVSVKTRLGFYRKEELETFLPEILREDLAAIVIHARTKKEMSKVPADWHYIKKAVQIRDRRGSQTLIIGNGDVNDLSAAKQKVKETGCDGVMIGRGIFGNPWLFNERVEKKQLPLAKQFKVMVEHAELFEKYFAGEKQFHIMRKHLKAYVSGLAGAKELRIKLMTANNAQEVKEIAAAYLQ